MNLDKARNFLDNWVCAARCLEEAQGEGLTKAELEAAAGEDLVACMMDAQVASADAKVSDLIEGDD
jgi:hypothetical protein